VELLVVIGIIALLISILLPSLKKARDSANAIACQSNLRQFGNFWSMYTSDSKGKFPSFDGSGWYDDLFPKPLKNYIRNYKPILFCPVAPEPKDQDWNLIRRGATFYAWTDPGFWPAPDEQYKGSYGQNGFVVTPKSFTPDSQPFYYNTTIGGALIKKVPARGSDNIPLQFDCAWIQVYPVETARPPAVRDILETTGGDMAYCCLDRHKGAINVLFLDFSVRPVGLKHLWDLKWHRTFNTAGQWTRAGGVQPNFWPGWMRKYSN